MNVANPQQFPFWQGHILPYLRNIRTNVRSRESQKFLLPLFQFSINFDIISRAFTQIVPTRDLQLRRELAFHFNGMRKEVTHSSQLYASIWPLYQLLSKWTNVLNEVSRSCKAWGRLLNSFLFHLLDRLHKLLRPTTSTTLPILAILKSRDVMWTLKFTNPFYNLICGYWS